MKTMNSLSLDLSIFLSPLPLNMLRSTQAKKKRYMILYRTCLLFLFLDPGYCCLRCCDNTKEERNYADIHRHIHIYIERERYTRMVEERPIFQHRHRSSVIILMLIHRNHRSRMLIVNELPSCCCVLVVGIIIIIPKNCRHLDRSQCY